MFNLVDIKLNKIDVGNTSSEYLYTELLNSGFAFLS
ncbi:hypothetical protein SAMN04487764_0027 [Gillisia sp. Hel1_33_143]|nr:hypothetical protein SAMN04487764_0027 [Gillisia sp. Hel1_33_143]